MREGDIYRRNLEWEADIFPLKLYNLVFSGGGYTVHAPIDCSLFRNQDFGLTCEVLAPFEALKKIKEDFIGKGNIVQGFTIQAVDAEGNTYTLKNCFIHIRESSSALGYPARREISMKSVSVRRKQTETGEAKKLNWYLHGGCRAHFKGITFRKNSAPFSKLRVGIDPYEDTVENFTSGSSSKDYFTLRYPSHECIVAKVPKNLVPQWANGLCLEYHGNQIESSEEKAELFCDFLSFLFGTELLYIGHTVLAGDQVIETYHTTPHEDALQEQMITPMPPVHFNLQYKWGNIDWLTQQLFPEFQRLYKPLKLDKVLSRYFHARSMPLGVNIPVLTTAFEILAVSYLKFMQLLEEKYIPDEQWNLIVGDMLKELEVKLAGLDGAEKILGKIKSANNRNGAEKMSLFFASVGIELGKKEKAVGALRNKMTHTARDYNDESNAHDDIVLTRVYQCLFHRTFLKLLGYNEYYIDYSLQGSPSRRINLSAGDK